MHANVWFTINKLFEFEFEYLMQQLNDLELIYKSTL